MVWSQEVGLEACRGLVGVFKEMRQKQLAAGRGLRGHGGGWPAWWTWGGGGPSPSFRIQLRHHLFQEPFRTLSGAGGASLPGSLPHLALVHSSLQSSAGLRAPGGPASPLRVPHKAWWEQQTSILGCGWEKPPLDTQQGEGRRPWHRAFSDSYLLPSLWPQAPAEGGQLQCLPRPVVGLGNHQGLMDLGGGRVQCAELGLEFVPSRPELLGRTALKHSTLPPSTLSTLPLSKASLPIFPATLSALLPTPHAP